MSKATRLESHLEGRVRVLRLVNSARKNALDTLGYEALIAAFEDAERDEDVRALVLTGSESCFCSGNDLDDFVTHPIADASHPAYRFMATLAEFDKPVVAAVEGPAVGIGATLLLHCDLVYAGDDARMHLPFVQLGVCPEFASTYVLPALVGHQRAAQLLMLGEPLGAAEACRLNLINQVVEKGAALAMALRVAQRLAQAPPQALRQTKRLLRQGGRAAFDAAMQAELAVLVRALDSDEFNEAMAARRKTRAGGNSTLD